MFWVYVLRSQKDGPYYIGSTYNVEKRLERHNQGLSRHTSKKIPWQIAYTEEFETRSLALKREKQIKRFKGGEAFKKLLKS